MLTSSDPTLEKYLISYTDSAANISFTFEGYRYVATNAQVNLCHFLNFLSLPLETGEFVAIESGPSVAILNSDCTVSNEASKPFGFDDISMSAPKNFFDNSTSRVLLYKRSAPGLQPVYWAEYNVFVYNTVSETGVLEYPRAS
jgi:hypothetical protein